MDGILTYIIDIYCIFCLLCLNKIGGMWSFNGVYMKYNTNDKKSVIVFPLVSYSDTAHCTYNWASWVCTLCNTFQLLLCDSLYPEIKKASDSLLNFCEPSATTWPQLGITDQCTVYYSFRSFTKSAVLGLRQF